MFSLSGLQSFEAPSDLSPFSIALLSVVWVTRSDCDYICTSIFPEIFSDYDATAVDQKLDLAVDACVQLLQALSSGMSVGGHHFKRQESY